jgi:hypothetical protein
MAKPQFLPKQKNFEKESKDSRHRKRKKNYDKLLKTWGSERGIR